MINNTYHRVTFISLTIFFILTTTKGHENYDNPNEPPHKDIDPVIEFPDNDPDYVPVIIVITVLCSATL